MEGAAVFTVSVSYFKKRVHLWMLLTYLTENRGATPWVGRGWLYKSPRPGADTLQWLRVLADHNQGTPRERAATAAVSPIHNVANTGRRGAPASDMCSELYATAMPLSSDCFIMKNDRAGRTNCSFGGNRCKDRGTMFPLMKKTKCEYCVFVRLTKT